MSVFANTNQWNQNPVCLFHLTLTVQFNQLELFFSGIKAVLIPLESFVVIFIKSLIISDKVQFNVISGDLNHQHGIPHIPKKYYLREQIKITDSPIWI